jgi:hypothetical protein
MFDEDPLRCTRSAYVTPGEVSLLLCIYKTVGIQALPHSNPVTKYFQLIPVTRLH